MDKDKTLPLPNNIERVCPGLTVKWFFDRKIVVYSLSASSMDVLNVWADTTVKIIDGWEADRPYLAIHDLSEKGISLSYAIKVQYNLMNLGITPAGKERIDVLTFKRENFKARVGLVFSPTFSGNMGQTFAQYHRTGIDDIDYRVFFELRPAFNWLREWA